MAVYSNEYLKTHPEVMTTLEKAKKYCESHCGKESYDFCSAFSLRPECYDTCPSDHV